MPSVGCTMHHGVPWVHCTHARRLREPPCTLTPARQAFLRACCAPAHTARRRAWRVARAVRAAGDDELHGVAARRVHAPHQQGADGLSGQHGLPKKSFPAERYPSEAGCVGATARWSRCDGQHSLNRDRRYITAEQACIVGGPAWQGQWGHCCRHHAHRLRYALIMDVRMWLTSCVPRPAPHPHPCLAG